MKPATPSAAVSSTHLLHVALADITPPLWRKLAVPSDLSLAELHEVLQIAFGWWNGHHHQFILKGKSGDKAGETYAADPILDLEEAKNSHALRLDEVCPRRGSTLRYQYDLTDAWMHEIEVLSVGPARGPTPACLDGARNGPMEDCGGADGHMDLAEAIAHPEDADPQMLEWAEGYDPERFDRAEINAVLKDWAAERAAQLAKGVKWRRSSLLWELSEIPGEYRK